MEIIGLSGYARAGKDEVANILVTDFGFKRVAFADKLREVLYALNPWVPTDDGEKPTALLQEVIDAYTWDHYKGSPYGTEIRRLLQRLGTEAGRETLWDSIWVDAALTGHGESDRLVISDCRFPNEFDAVKERGGSMWRIRRPGIGPANSHASETSLDTHLFDEYIENDGTLEDLAATVAKRLVV